MRRRRRPLGPPAVVFRRLFVVVVFFASMRAANALSADESDDDDDERVEFDVDADDYSNAFATLMNAAEDDDDDENMESYALQLDDFTGEILKPPRQKARREPEWMASLTSLPSNCTRSRKGDGRETTRTEELDVSLRRMPLRLPTNRIALKDIFVTRENYKRLGFGGIKRYYALPPNAAAIAKKYRWKRCAVLGNSGARKDVNASRVAFFKRLRKWREHSRRSLSLSLSLSLFRDYCIFCSRIHRVLTRVSLTIGTLLDASFGGTIDSHDVVFRMNQAPVKGYELHVGKKSTFRVLNSLWSHRYSHGYAPWDPGYQNLPLEKDVTLILTRVDATIFNEMHEFWRKRRPDITLLILSSKVINIIRQTLVDYRSRLCAAGVESAGGSGGNTPSSGWVSVYAAMQLCGKVNAYGFGTKVAKEGENGGNKDVSYHYYTGMAARKFGTDVHSFESEKMLIEHLDRSKKITLCTSAGSKEDSVKKHRRGFIPVDAQCGKA